jgi:hypothetical protein
MRDQYAGDVTDMIKFSLLRALTGEGRTLGMAWYFVDESDGRRDGRHREYIDEPGWPELDPAVHAALARVPASSPSVARLEGDPSLWPQRVCFHRAPIVPTARAAWRAEMVAATRDATLVFADPDNGLGEDRVKHASADDVAALSIDGTRPVVFIHFPSRQGSHDEQDRRVRSALVEVGFDDASVLTLRTTVRVPSQRSGHRVPRQRFFVIANADAELRERAGSFAARLAAVPHAGANLRSA